MLSNDPISFIRLLLLYLLRLTNSAASPGCFINDPIPSLTATATLLTALLTLLLPLNACKWSNSFSYNQCYSAYDPNNSATSPECFQMIQFLSYGYCCSIYYGLLTLRLLLDALQLIQLYLLQPLLLYLWPYQLCYFTWMPYKWSNSLSNGHCYSTYGPTNSAASPECLQMIQFLLLQSMLLCLRP